MEGGEGWFNGESLDYRRCIFCVASMWLVRWLLTATARDTSCDIHVTNASGRIIQKE